MQAECPWGDVCGKGLSKPPCLRGAEVPDACGRLPYGLFPSRPRMERVRAPSTPRTTRDSQKESKHHLFNIYTFFIFPLFFFCLLLYLLWNTPFFIFFFFA